MFTVKCIEKRFTAAEFDCCVCATIQNAHAAC